MQQSVNHYFDVRLVVLCFWVERRTEDRRYAPEGQLDKTKAKKCREGEETFGSENEGGRLKPPSFVFRADATIRLSRFLRC